MGMMQEARNEKEAEANLENENNMEGEERKLKAGAALVERATERVRQDVSSSGSEGADEKVKGAGRKRCRMISHGACFEGELDRFSKTLHEAESTHVEVDRERLGLERERLRLYLGDRAQEMEARREEMEQERAPRVQDRNSKNELEVKNVKLMMQVLTGRK